MLNALIVVWRESLEAMLVVGVLLAWIARQEDASRLRRTLWSGVGGGTLLALALAFLAYGAQTWLDGESLELFQIGMLLLACVLMTQMVMWMRRHGASMKRELEAGASRAAETGGRLGVALVAALAIGREGMETVVFLYGMAAERQGSELLGLYGMAALGFVITGLTAWAVARGARFLSYRTFFRISEVVLLVTAGALLGTGVDKLIGIDRLPTDTVECVNHINDVRICPKCAGKLRYEYRRYHHIGRAVCQDCGFHSPDSDYLATNVDIPGGTMTIREDGWDEILLLRETNEQIAIWEGARLTQDQARELSGIRDVRWTNEYDTLLDTLVPAAIMVFVEANQHPRCTCPVETRNARMTKELKEKFPDAVLKNVYEIMADMRQIKKPEEIKALKKACDIVHRTFSANKKHLYDLGLTLKSK